MSPSVLLFTDRPGFEPTWRPACESLDLGVRTLSPDALPSAARTGVAVVIDAASPAYDEDELLVSVGFAKALGAPVAVHLPEGHGLGAVEDVLDELCPGLVARRGEDVTRVTNLLARRLDPQRDSRFEFVTVSPRDEELLAILGDGRSVLVSRPVGDDDDGSEVEGIALADDARSATLALAGGGEVRLTADKVARTSQPPAANGRGGNGIPIDGERLGARLRELRLEAGLTQAELARRTGIHRPNIARVEAGRHTPSLETLARLASAIGVPTTRVLSED
jgi:DNA-binding XRE family transcriptional regulator